MYPDVQAAVATYMQPEIQEATFRWLCPTCGSSAPPRKVHHVIAAPQMLLVQLCRWQAAGATGAILDAVNINERLQFQGFQYRLCSSILHQGDRPSSGHYIAHARHASANDAWFLYNDTMRRLLRNGERESDTVNKSYIMFYERIVDGA